ncbi:MAG TPA: STAS domain-containing protein [Silvibacterium sp.]|nr:STAS domain-containing protein [Silvibacterium sp.]
MPLTLKTHFCGKIFVIHCAGRIMAGQETLTLESALNQAQHEFALFVLNLGEVTRLDSTGLGLLVRHTARLNKRGGTIRLAGAQPFVAHLLGITKLSGFLQSYPTEEEAIQSFATPRSAHKPESPSGLRLLVFDPSADLCSFIQAVLAPHGFDVRTTCSLRDAKTLLRVDEVDCILVGPGTPQLSSGAASQELSAVSPNASSLWLDADFKSRDASSATEALLQMFGVSSASQIPEPCP